jgi:hypothetical protein
MRSQMKFLRPLFVIILILILAGVAWIWWDQPRKVDMADYVPADSFVYLEFNSLTDLATAIEQNDAWKATAPVTGASLKPQNRWISMAAESGIGPATGVIFSRAQLALVVVGMNTTEGEDTLRVKPEVALLIETHTSHWRIKSVALNAIRQLANFAYGQAICIERGEEKDFVECASGQGDRKIVGAIDGSLVVIGNTEKAVRSCLEVRQGLRPSLRTDREMLRVRASLGAEKSLGFGYISSANAAKLFSWGAPLLIGKAPGDQRLEPLLAASAGKILRGVAWTSSPSLGGIEDRFLFSLEPAVASRLEPAFNAVTPDDNFWRLVPDTFQSLTIYRSKDPVAAWSALDSAVSIKLDAVSAVLFGSLLKSGLSVYGIDDPKLVLSALAPPLLTVKTSSGTSGSVMLARIDDQERLRHALAQEVFKGGNGQIIEGLQMEPDANKEFTAVFIDNYLIVGKTEAVRPFLAALKMSQTADRQLELFRHFAPQSSSAILTYADDDARFKSFVTVVSFLRGVKLSQTQLAALQTVAKGWTFSATETNLNSTGIERKTRSAFGQFSTILSLAQQDSSNPFASQ